MSVNDPPTRRELAKAVEDHERRIRQNDALVMMLLQAQAGGPECRCGHPTALHIAGRDRCLGQIAVLGKYKQCECMTVDENRVTAAKTIITGVR
jgi:hypothetical protein